LTIASISWKLRDVDLGEESAAIGIEECPELPENRQEESERSILEESGGGREEITGGRRRSQRGRTGA